MRFLIHLCVIHFISSLVYAWEQRWNVSYLKELSDKMIMKNDYQANAEKLLLELIRHKNKQPMKEKKKLLCSTFVKWSTVERDVLVSNIVKSDSVCSGWAVLLYNRNGTSIEDIQYDINAQIKQTYTLKGIYSYERVQLKLIDVPPKVNSMPILKKLCQQYLTTYLSDLHYDFSPCDYIRSPQEEYYYTALFSKGIFYLLVLPETVEYEHIWLIDSDLSFDTLDLPKFYTLHQCAFPTPPIVSQALITPRTQYYEYVNRLAWDNAGHSAPSILAMETDFIEIQSPLFQTPFFEWFVLGFLVPLIPSFQLLGVDWGMDFLFCPTANLYSSYLLQHNTTATSTIPFAVMISDLAIHHLNLRTAARTTEFIELNEHLVQTIGIQYPLEGFYRQRGSPLKKKNVYQAAYELTSSLSSACERIPKEWKEAAVKEVNES